MSPFKSLFFGLSFVFSSPAFGLDAAEILAKLDTNMNQATDQTLNWTVTTQDPGKKSAREMAFSVRLKGEKTLTEFESPGDIKGTRVLVLSRSQMYIYLPAYHKVRRIASHVTKQGFMGTTYSHADMSTSRYGDAYTAKLVSENETDWVIALHPIPETHAPYAKIEMTVGKARHLPQELKMFNDKGEHIKTESRSEYDCKGSICNPTLLKMTDHTRNGAWTELRCVGWAADTGVEDGLFTVRTLQRGG